MPGPFLMNLIDLHLLRTPTGERALAAAAARTPVERDFLHHLQALRHDFPDALARAALETAILRRRARTKFGDDAARMVFTREAPEQATGRGIAAYRAPRFAQCHRILDCGCSIGGDLLELARIAPATGIDLDPLRAAMARWNIHALEDRAHPAHVVQADLHATLPATLDAHTGIFFDPARRPGGRRTRSVTECEPPLNVIDRWRNACPAIGVKLSPALRLDEVAAWNAEVEFISVKHELREAVLWFGPLRTAKRRATLIGSGGIVSLDANDESGGMSAGLSRPRRYLLEPDPAVLRAGLVAAVATQTDAAQLDPTIAYLTADTMVPTPFGAWWEIDAAMPFQLKRLRALLRERGIGRVAVKRRGSAISPDELIARLRLRGEGKATVVLTRVNSEPWVLVCTPRAAG